MTMDLNGFDPELSFALGAEEKRQLETLELAASENIVSPRVREALGSALVNKYAPGVPGSRYHGGCDFVDIAEKLATERATSLFGTESASVQAYSGVQANMAVYFAILKPGDPILCMDPNLQGQGHMAHGGPLHFSGTLYRTHFYGVNGISHCIDYDQVRDLALRFRPKLIVAGSGAHPRLLDYARFRQIADEVGAQLLADMDPMAGIVAAGLSPSPVPHAHVVTATTHKTLRGPWGGLILCSRELVRKINLKTSPGIQGAPLCQVIAAKAAAFKEARTPAFKAYAAQVLDNARALARSFLDRGYRLVTGGTDTHLIQLDLSKTELSGEHAERLLELAGVMVNRIRIPFDPRSPLAVSGICMGTQALTSRGMGTGDMDQVADFIHRVLDQGKRGPAGLALSRDIAAFARSFPGFADTIGATP
ncbi:MAG: serine hydroxymethyltransferase [Desulfobacterales bacterium]|nr:serine hydroxymethyltransferase [Desulfobacterales bacterium]